MKILTSQMDSNYAPFVIWYEGMIINSGPQNLIDIPWPFMLSARLLPLLPPMPSSGRGARFSGVLIPGLPASEAREVYASSIRKAALGPEDIVVYGNIAK